MKNAVLMCSLCLSALLTAKPALAAEPGAIQLSVDLMDAPRQVFHARESIPVKPGALTIYYPKWIPGEHSPSGPLENLTGVKFSAGGKAIAWRRDAENMYAFLLQIPAGVSMLEASFDFLSPSGGGEFGQSVSATPDIADLEWNQVVLYPAGSAAKDILFDTSVKLPPGWQFATALDTDKTAGGETHFKRVGLNKLVDSPLIAGQYFRQVDLAPGDKVPVHLDLVADAPEDLDISADETTHFRSLVQQAYALFGTHHYDHYEFLLTLSDETGHFGLEHHQSSDDRSFADFLIEPGTELVGAHLLPHEYVHSWNGKFRRPAGLWTPDFNTQPMKGELLWVYEGLTEYFGDVLMARSGLATQEQYREQLAYSAATMDHRVGRAWRPLQDTADEAQILYYAPGSWQSWRRSTDFYSEGELLWLDADTKIRELSKGQRSLNDFARVFFGMDDGSYVTKTYSFDDVVAALNQVQPYDWAAFLHTRLDSTQPGAPLDGISRGGYQLGYSDTRSEFFKAYEKRRKLMNEMYSVGIMVGGGHYERGRITDVLWDGPAAKAGVAPGMQLVAVNGRDFNADPEHILQNAIKTAQHSKQPIRLLLRNQDMYINCDVDYHDGLKYPQLVRVAGKPALLDDITTPLK
jgi:predicted metalloprotease with PDZ domain